MAELKWRTPVPQKGELENIDIFIQRLVRWLKEQEREADYDLEEILAFGGVGVAYRTAGFEGKHTPSAPPETTTLLTGPAAPSKYIVIGLHVGTLDATPADFYLRKAGADNLIATLPATSDKPVIGGGGSGPITLDAADESIIMKTRAGATLEYGWTGSYVNVT